MTTTAIIATAFTPRPFPLRANVTDATDAKRAEAIAWLRGRLDWEDRVAHLHNERASSRTQEHVRSSGCRTTPTR